MKRVLKLLICLTMVIVTPSFAATLPAGYTELEYIQSTGTQYIDTGVTENRMTYMEMEFNNQGNGGFMFINGTSQVGMHDSRYGTEELNTKYKIKQEYNGSSGKWIYTNITNGTTYTNGTRSEGKMLLFVLMSTNGAVLSQYFCKTKVYSFTASYNGVLIRNMIPARNSSGVVGMYDTVSERFFTNAGTGDFVAGPVAQIKIATTKYTEDAFAGLVATLESAINKVTNIVDTTVQQATEIGELAQTKQDRPDTDCPAGRKCLLIMGADNKPHWYLIEE